MRRQVVAIGIDSADPALVEAWMGEGRLETLARLRSVGAYGRLTNNEQYLSEAPWTVFATGCRPSKTGYWSPIHYDQNRYSVDQGGAYDYRQYAPFYSQERERRIAIFDLPQVRIQEELDGIQITGWAAHSPRTPRESSPASLMADLIRDHGDHHGFLNGFASCYDAAAGERGRARLREVVAGRSAICRQLLADGPWDLFLTVFSEWHTSAHDYWHLSQSHPLTANGAAVRIDVIGDTFEAIDRGLGEILAQVPEDAYVVVFSIHGMIANFADLNAMLFLPELLYRRSFPGKAALAIGRAGAIPEALERDFSLHWSREVWKRRRLPDAEDLAEPDQQKSDGLFLQWQPANWYMPAWPRMTAFALPTYLTGCIRLNVQGREAQGLIAPGDYDAFCEELSDDLMQLVNARSGRPIIQDVVRMRDNPADSGPEFPDADLLVHWQPDAVADAVEHPKYGRFGPVPYYRTGAHRSDGFLFAKGPGILPTSDLPESDAIDVPPTILSLMGAAQPNHMDGTPILLQPF